MGKWDSPVTQWEQPPIKSFNARIIGVYDIGTQDGYQGGDPSHQMVWEYELISAQHKDSQGKNFRISEFLTYGNHSKSKSVARIQGVTGIKFPVKEGSQSANGFFYNMPPNMSQILGENVLGAPCLVYLSAKPDGKPKVETVGQPMEGYVVPAPENGLGWLDGEEPREKYLRDLAAAPEWIRKKVNASHEARTPVLTPIHGNAPAYVPSAGAATGSVATQPKVDRDPETGAPLQAPAATAYEDDIPF